MKKAVSLLLSVIVGSTVSVAAVSTAQADENTVATIATRAPEYSVEITDTTTGRTVPVVLDSDDVKITKTEITAVEGISRGYSLLSDATERTYTESVQIDVGDQVAAAFGLDAAHVEPSSNIRALSSDSGFSTKNSDVKVTAGLTYSANAGNNTVKVSRAFGSTVNKGSYYVQRRHFFWSNPGNGRVKTYHPTVGSWNYSVSDSWAGYNGSNPPYAITDAFVRVYGMDGQVQISVMTYQV
jgi:hypothetical protein